MLRQHPLQHRHRNTRKRSVYLTIEQIERDAYRNGRSENVRNQTGGNQAALCIPLEMKSVQRPSGLDRKRPGRSRIDIQKEVMCAGRSECPVERSAKAVCGIRFENEGGPGRNLHPVKQIVPVRAHGDRRIQCRTQPNDALDIGACLGESVTILIPAEDRVLRNRIGKFVFRANNKTESIVQNIEVVLPLYIDQGRIVHHLRDRSLSIDKGIARVVEIRIGLGEKPSGVEAKLPVCISEPFGLSRTDTRKHNGLGCRISAIGRQRDVRTRPPGKQTRHSIAMVIVIDGQRILPERGELLSVQGILRIEGKVVGARKIGDDLVSQLSARNTCMAQGCSQCIAQASPHAYRRTRMGKRILTDEMDHSCIDPGAEERRSRTSDHFNALQIDLADRHQAIIVQAQGRHGRPPVIRHDIRGSGEDVIEPSQHDLIPVDARLRHIHPGYIPKQQG